MRLAQAARQDREQQDPGVKDGRFDPRAGCPALCACVRVRAATAAAIPGIRSNFGDRWRPALPSDAQEVRTILFQCLGTSIKWEIAWVGEPAPTA